MSNARPRRLSIIVAGERDATRQDLHAIVQRTFGPRVRAALDAWEVMSLLLMPGSQVDLVVCELGVLRGNGLDALVPIRAAGIGVPFLLVGGPVRPALHATAARLGALVLDEPVEVSDLVAGVHQLCERSGSRDPGRRGGHTAC